MRASLKSYVADVDDVFALSSRKTDAGRRVRWAQDSSCNIAIIPEVPYRVYGTSTWKTQASWLTNTSGTVSVTVQPKKKMYYRWYYAGTASVTGAYSAQAYFTY
jgi:hypothetical protein